MRMNAIDNEINTKGKKNSVISLIYISKLCKWKQREKNKMN